MARILLADDDGGSLDFMSRALISDGHVVVGAQDGLEAEEQLASGPFDILITDIEMPGLDGIELAKRATTANGALKVLLVSGFAGSLDQASGIAGGNVKAVSKPLSLEQIRSEVRALLG
ncbi:MAG: transcriptional regulator [Pseudomonadota bacterium]